MTKSPDKVNKSKMSAGQTLFCIMSAAAMILTFRYSEVAISAMSVGMRLCVTTVIPSLFPFMVFSELFISSGAGRLLGKYPGRPVSALFGISHDGASALLLGFLCGFPIGTKSAISLYEKGRIGKAELEHICVFCNNPSSAFLVSAVGSTLFGCHTFGVLLYVTHIISSCIVGFACRYIYAERKRKDSYFTAASGKERREGIVGSVIRAVTDSAGSMLFICAFVVFFSAVVGFLRFFAEGASVPEGAIALMFGFFEMTGGVSAASVLPPGAAIPIAAAITGWSGLSVHFQFIAVCKEHRLPLRPYFVSKIICALLNALIISLLVALAGDGLTFEGGGSVSSFLLMPDGLGAWGAIAVFAAGCAGLWGRSRQKRK